jgi:hypothetical protein
MKSALTVCVCRIVLIGLLCKPVPSQAQMVSMDMAANVAKNWVSLMLQVKGNWGGSRNPEVLETREFRLGQRLVGYFCPVSPRGYVVVSLYRELAPVKFTSEVSNLDPDLEEGPAGVMKSVMSEILVGRDHFVQMDRTSWGQSPPQNLEIDFRDAWTEQSISSESFMRSLSTNELKANYSAGEVLLSTSWDQGDPYNRQCPIVSPCANRCLAGCMAIAHAQIMRYWSWPPYGDVAPYNTPYDWGNMPDSLAATLPAAQIDAVAELCYEVGLAIYTHYCEYGTDCYGSSAFAHEDELYKKHFRYSDTSNYQYRKHFSAVGWYDHLKAQFQQNRPVSYGIPGHMVVADGWREIGSLPIRQYHINYGHGGSNTGWWTVDGIPGGNATVEWIYENIVPSQAIGDTVNGLFSLPTFPYRYFDRDAQSTIGATFEDGQLLQFLAGVKLINNNVSTGSIRFLGTNALPTQIFANGVVNSGVLIRNGAMKLHKGGGIVLSPVAVPREVAATTGTGNIQLLWEQGRGQEDGFQIERRVGSGTYTLLTTVGAGVTSYMDNTVTVGSSYSYRLRTKWRGGYSDYSSEVSILCE